jgi:hypothetical protein
MISPTSSLFSGLYLLLLLMATGEGAAQVDQKSQESIAADSSVFRVHSVSINKIHKEYDGQWQGITVASDGNCYFSSSTHSIAHGAGFHRFNPETQEHTVLADDMTIVCGEENTHSQQGKIHSPIVELEGWLYFTTHLSNYWKEGIENYTGAHVIGYQMATGKFRDLGIVRPRYSIYSAINVDPIRKKLYVFVAPFTEETKNTDGCHLYSVDIATGEKKDLGQLTQNQSGASLWFFVDDQGNCWFTLWKGHYQYTYDRGNLYCYRPETDKIETYKDVLPTGQFIDGTPVTNERLYQERAWTWAQAFPDQKKCYFTMGTWGGGDERLWIFDPAQDIASGAAFQPVAAIGSTFLQTAIGGDRLYFVQYADLQDERDLDSENERERDPDEVGYDESLHLRSVSLTGGLEQAVKDHGKIVDQDGRAARFINSMAADEQGRVYMYGSWYVQSPQEATLQYQWTEHPNGNVFKLLKRGEFFAFADAADGKKE